VWAPRINISALWYRRLRSYYSSRQSERGINDRESILTLFGVCEVWSMLTGRGAGGHQESCRNRRVAYSEIEFEAVNRMDPRWFFRPFWMLPRERGFPSRVPAWIPGAFMPQRYMLSGKCHTWTWNLELCTLNQIFGLWSLAFGPWS